MKTELLVQMDGLARSDDLVFLLAASNLPWYWIVCKAVYYRFYIFPKLSVFVVEVYPLMNTVSRLSLCHRAKGEKYVSM